MPTRRGKMARSMVCQGKDARPATRNVTMVKKGPDSSDMIE
jgi:hypothetical protein